MKILLVEQDPELMAAINHALTKSDHVVECASNGIHGLSRALDGEYAALILDRRLPGLDGLDVVKRLRANGRETPVLFISQTSDVPDRIESLESGADDYLVQPFALAELIARLHVIIRRLDPQRGRGVTTRLSVGDLHIDLINRTVRRSDKLIELQAREFELLEYLMRNAGRVVTKSILLQNVWDRRVRPASNLVETHVSRLRSKLNLGHRSELIHTVRGKGYIMRAD